ncbi:murein DD-endopeptidase MepM/ murein hydrolase activator NlpD [Sphingomonas naasensis]|uniref:M23 family metallopeptidase n=1 Tax=Sphingomonas naasensis TaxID=1344951 RepID=A0A4S1WRA2_9SPHN|nr:M23 family metallopeptidase [Sphingomonas naasensis]NIJ20598.1 murein DD-endopeptidase MepM/ murein hydrolase activator NlpD [Sphingomonas naasensis]TGX44677.1 M23 family metallopeptidase [Sphingomonas naasensis]
MANVSNDKNANLAERFRQFFTTRDFIFHDGRDLRRFSIAGRTQALLAGAAAITVLFSGYGVSQAMAGAIAVSGVNAAPGSPEAQVAQMRAQVAKMQAEVAAAKQAAKLQATRVEQRQALISAVLNGKVDPVALDGAVAAPAPKTSAVADEMLAPLRQVEQRQAALAGKARLAGEARYQQTASHFRRLGLAPERFVKGGMGGPYEPMDDNNEGTAGSDSAESADAQFRALFLTWKKLDALEQTVISIPSMQPVDKLQFTSSFGVRSDPFRGTAAMHAGVDIPGTIGTPIYATADGVISHAGRQGGYGNLVQINHGRGIETRYGHLSKILVADNTRVRRGQMIGLMGSTGRSTGSHLHYEVRVDGKAVNPIPFLQTGEYLTAVQNRAQGGVGGPAK